MTQEAGNAAPPSAGFASYPSLRGRVVMVSGGASGIGEQIVEAFTRQGAQVVFLDIQDEAAENVVRNAQRRGDAVPSYCHCDVTDIDALRACAENTVGRLGAIDVLVNNAGDDSRHKTEEVTPEYWDRCMAVNLKHQFFLAQAVLPAMKKAGRGSIVNISSIAWVIPSVGVPVYVAAKAAIAGLSRTLAHELGPYNIRVNCIMPGAIQTARQIRLWYTDEYKDHILKNQALKRMILPEEVARLVLFLAADDSSAITNQSYVIDGGWV